MQIRRERDAELINRITNDPAVYPFIAYHGESIDWTPAMRSASGVIVLSNGEDACAAFELTGEAEYQSHTFFAPTCRGKRAVETGKAMVQWMFDHNAKRVWGRTPVKNRQARIFNRLIGAKQTGFDESLVEGEVEIFEVRAH